MKTRFAAQLLAALLLPVVALPAAAAPDNRPKLAIVVVENVQRHGGAITDFDRLDLAFQYVAKQRQWPVAIAAERFAANTPAHETELRIFSQPLREERPGELTFRGWMTLTIGPVKHDFGIITFRYYPRALENREDVFEKVFRGAAEVAAGKIEPLLFPPPGAPKS